MSKIDIDDICDEFVLKIVSLFFEYLEKEKKYSINTVTSYRNDVHNFIFYIYKSSKKIVDKNFLENTSVDHYRSWLSDRLNDHINNSNARALSSLRSFFRFCYENNFLENRQIFKIKTPKVSRPLPRAVEFVDIKKIVSIIENYHNDEWESKRDLAILYLVYGCGLRISEALSINQLMLQSGESITITGKGNKQRIIPLMP
ncbi:MAG: tyrosine recombinase XerC, partial [Alphaproteobacteria bacterium]|nr:tyrosine recombinase XerC [Alphaproteobacteria bacterium]